MKKSPKAEVTERFGSKENLIKVMKDLFDKGELFVEKLNAEKGVARISSAKLLRLHRVATEVKERFTTREKLVQDLLATLKRTKDEGFKTRLDGFSLPRLWDYYKAVSKHTSRPV